MVSKRNKIIQIANPDLFGVVASGLCLVHCAAIPFLFIAKACSLTCCAGAPVWWQIIDYLFIIISFFAIHYATKKSSKSWVKIALWVSWALLLFTIMGETLQLSLLPTSFIYFPSMSIVPCNKSKFKRIGCFSCQDS